MGLAASTGKDNDELVDNLIDGENIHSEKVELAMRLVDRGRYFPEDNKTDAYKDSAWKSDQGDPGPLHLSAPCIYASVLENLDLRPGMSFLNIGSGTGYLSTMAGFLIGEKGINHGVEIYENIVDYAYERLQETLKTVEVSAFSWCEPQFFVGNGFLLHPNMKYDRIYCGALVPGARRGYFCKFLKIGGICVMPFGNALQKVERVSENQFKTYDISAVTFSNLIQPNDTNQLTKKEATLSGLEPPTLRDLCRQKVRHLVREAVSDECHLDMKIQLADKNKKARNRRRRRDRVGIRPVIFFGGGEGDDDEDNPARILDIFGQIHQVNEDGDQGDGHGGPQRGPNRNRRDRRENDGEPVEEEFIFEPVRPPRPPARRGRLRRDSDSDTDRNPNEPTLFPDPRPGPTNGNNREDNGSNRTRFDSTSSSSSDDGNDLRRFAHGVGQPRRPRGGEANDRNLEPYGPPPPCPGPYSPPCGPIKCALSPTQSPEPGPSSSITAAPKPISGQKLQEIRKYFAEPSNSQNLHRRRYGHRIRLVPARDRDQGGRRAIRVEPVRLPDSDSSESSDEEPRRDRNNANRPGRDNEPRNITAILRDLMRLRRQTVRLHRAAAPLVRNIPRARSATDLANQAGTSNEIIALTPLSDGDVGFGEGSSTASSAYASARGSTMGVGRPPQPEDPATSQRRTRLREELQQQMQDLQNLRTRLEHLQERTRRIADRQAMTDEQNQLQNLEERRTEQVTRLTEVERQILELEQQGVLDEQGVSEERRLNQEAQHLLSSPSSTPNLQNLGSSSRTRPFEPSSRAQSSRTRSQERPRDRNEERWRILEPRPRTTEERRLRADAIRQEMRNFFGNRGEVFRQHLDARRRERENNANAQEPGAAPVMRANSPPRGGLAISERESSLPRLSRQGSLERHHSEPRNMDQLPVSSLVTAMDESSRDTQISNVSSNTDEQNCACSNLSSMLTSLTDDQQDLPFHQRDSGSTLASSSSNVASTSRGTMTSKKRSRADTTSEDNTRERKRRTEPHDQPEHPDTLTPEETRDSTLDSTTEAQDPSDPEPMEQDIGGSFSPSSDILPPSHVQEHDQMNFATDDNNSTLEAASENGSQVTQSTANTTRRVMDVSSSSEDEVRFETLRERRARERENRESTEERERQQVRQRQIESLRAFHEQFCDRVRHLPLSMPLIKFLLHDF